MENKKQLLLQWSGLFRTSGVLIVLMLIIIPVQIVIFTVSPMPVSIDQWIQLFVNQPVLGMLHLDLLYLINTVILSIIYFALAILVFNENKSITAIALILGLVGIAAYFPSNTCIEMLFLTRNYSDMESLRQAATILLLEWKGTAFTVYYILNAIALLLLSIAMQKNPLFKKRTAILGIVSGILMMIPSTFGMIGLIFSMLSLIPWYIFCIDVSVLFLRKPKLS